MSVKNDLVSTQRIAEDWFRYDFSRPGQRAAFLQFARREGVPFYKVSNRRFMWSVSEIQEWLESRREGGVGV